MLTLAATIHWFSVPQDEYAREALLRRWAFAVHSAGLTEQQAGGALNRYLEVRKAKDPIPEPDDIFKHVKHDDLDPLQVGLAHYIKWIRRAQSLNARPAWLVWGAIQLEGVNGDTRPDNLPELLDRLGYPVHSRINQFDLDEILNNRELEKELENELDQHK